MSGGKSVLAGALRRRLDELRARRGEIERRHAELQRMLGSSASEYVRTGGALDEQEYRFELAGSKQQPPSQAGGGGD